MPRAAAPVPIRGYHGWGCMANRDTRGSELARRLWALLGLRVPLSAGHVVLSSRCQTERLAAVELPRRAAGVLHPPGVLLLGGVPPETLVLVLAESARRTLRRCRAPRGRRCGDSKPLAAAHDAGVAHRNLADNVIITESSAGFSSLDSALPKGHGDSSSRCDSHPVACDPRPVLSARQRPACPASIRACVWRKPLRSGVFTGTPASIALAMPPSVRLPGYGPMPCRRGRG